MPALDRLSPRARSMPSVRSLASSLDRARARNRTLKEQASQSVGTVRTTGAIQAGAFIAGAASAKRAELMGVPTAAVIGLLGIGAGAAVGSADVVHAANGALALVAGAAGARMAAPAGDGGDA